MSEVRSFRAVYPLWSDEQQAMTLEEASQRATWQLACELSDASLTPISAVRWELHDGPLDSLQMVASVLVRPLKVLGG